MKNLFVVSILLASLCPIFGEGILSEKPIELEKVDLKTVSKDLSSVINKFLVAINDQKRGGDLVILELDVKSNFREIAVPEEFSSQTIERNRSPEFESKILYKVDENYYILMYDSKDSKPSGNSPTVTWKMGKNSWHIFAFRDPLDLAIHKLNIKRAMEDIELSKKADSKSDPNSVPKD